LIINKKNHSYQEYHLSFEEYLVLQTKKKQCITDLKSVKKCKREIKLHGQTFSNIKIFVFKFIY
jgi:hypothetical protein